MSAVSGELSSRGKQNHHLVGNELRTGASMGLILPRDLRRQETGPRVTAPPALFLLNSTPKTGLPVFHNSNTMSIAVLQGHSLCLNTKSGISWCHRPMMGFNRSSLSSTLSTSVRCACVVNQDWRCTSRRLVSTTSPRAMLAIQLRGETAEAQLPTGAL